MEILHIYKKMSEETLYLLKENNYIAYSKNAEILLEVLSKAYKNTNSISKSKLLQSFENMMDDLLGKMYKEGYLKEVNELSLKYIEVIRESVEGKEENIYYPEVLDKVFKSTTDKSKVEEIQEINKILNEIKQSNISHINELGRYNNLYYFNLATNRNISKDELENLRKSFTKQLIYNLNYKKNKSLLLAELRTLYLLLRDFSLNGNEKDLNSLLNQIFTAEKLSRKGLFNKVITVLFLNVYYIGIRENDVDLEKRINLKDIFKYKILIEGKQIIELIKNFYIDDLWNLYSEVYEEFVNKGWEIIKENEVKTLRMNSYVNEFFIFFSIYLSNKNWYHLDIGRIEDISWDKLNELIKYFDDTGKLKSDYRDNFQSFILLVCEENEQFPQLFERLLEVSQFGDEILSVYKKRLLKEIVQKKALIDSSQEIEKEKRGIYERFENWVFKDISNIITSEDIYREIKIDRIAIESLLDIEQFDNNVIKYGFELSDSIVSILENRIMNQITEFVEIKELNYRDQNKISKILNIIQGDVKVNSRISSDRITRAMNFRENSSDVALLESKLNSLTSYGNFNDLHIEFYFNDALLSFKNFSINIEIRDLTEEEIIEEIEKEYNEENYSIKIEPNTKLQLNREEIQEYYKNKFYKLKVYLKGEIFLDAPKVGYLITFS